MPLKIVLLCLSFALLSSSLFADNEIKGDSFNVLSNIRSSKFTLKKHEGGEVQGIFDGNVHFAYKEIASFHSDRLTVYLPAGTMIERVEMSGNVSMKKGAYEISSQRAVSDDLQAYVIFLENVIVQKNGSIAEFRSIRFNTRAETIEDIEEGPAH